jgi:hypothetical protein
MKQKIIIKGKTAFYLFALTCAIVIITIWLTGLDIHRTISNNALYSLTIITLIFFSFVAYGLYRGVGLMDNFGSVKNKVTFVEPSGISGDIPTADFPIGEFASDGLEGILIGLVLWIGIFILTVVLVFFFETIVFAGLVIFTGMLYWIFYRATKLIFRYSRLTKNNLKKSISIGLKYSLMYSGWIYGIIWIIKLLKK